MGTKNIGIKLIVHNRTVLHININNTNCVENDETRL